jgi:hypothetical protein
MAEVLNTQYQGDLGATRQQANEYRRRVAKEKNMARLMEQSKRLSENSDHWQASRTSGAMPPLINTGPRSDSQGTASSTVEDAGTEGGEQSQNFLRRSLSSLRGKAKGQAEEKGSNVLQQQAEEKIKKEVARKLTLRAVNIAFGASVALAIVTVIIWTVQFIGGNMMGSKLIPKLGLGETILWLICLIIVSIFIDVIILGITLMIEIFENPTSIIGNVISIFWSGFWNGLLGK